jgi:hypothetical protein
MRDRDEPRPARQRGSFHHFSGQAGKRTRSKEITLASLVPATDGRSVTLNFVPTRGRAKAMLRLVLAGAPDGLIDAAGIAFAGATLTATLPAKSQKA